MYRAVLFDIDGTLVDSNDAHAAAWVDVLAEHGHHLRFDDVRPLIGMGGDKVLPALTGIDAASPPGRAIIERRGHIFKRVYLPHLQATDGASELVRYLNEAGVALAVATSAQKDEVHALLRVAGVDGLFDGEGSSNDADRSKPDPDIVQVALGKLGCAASEAVMIGDTPYDIEAARHAGVDCIALRCGGWWRDDDFTGALAIYDGPRALLENLRAREQPLLAR